MILQDANSGFVGSHVLTLRVRYAGGIRLVCFHLTAFGYSWPADRGDAPSAATRKYECVDSSNRNR